MFNIKKEGGLDLEKRFKLLLDWENNELAGQLGEIAHEHFLKSFPKSNSARGGGRTDASKGGWLPRKVKYNHPTLNRSGRLIRSIKLQKRTSYSKVYTNLDYAGYHNIGSGRLPKREFIGKSRILTNYSRRYIKAGLDLIFNVRNPRRPNRSNVSIKSL